MTPNPTKNASSPTSGDAESFWNIQIGTLRLCNHGDEEMRWPEVAITSKARRLHEGRRVNEPVVIFT